MISIVAYSQNNIIGNDLEIPWKLSLDMKWFQKVTKTRSADSKVPNFMLMGRKTFDSFKGRMLKDRIHCVLTRNFEFKIPDVLVAEEPIFINSIKDYALLVEKFKPENEYCIGGAAIYKLMENNAESSISPVSLSAIYATKVLKNVCGNIEYAPDENILKVDMKTNRFIDNETDCEHVLFVNNRLSNDKIQKIKNNFINLHESMQEHCREFIHS